MALPDPHPHSHTPPDSPQIPAGLLAGFESRELAKGCLFSTPAGPRDLVFMVESGRLRVYLTGENRELSLCFLEPGDIYTTHTPTYVQALVPSTVWVINTAAFPASWRSIPRSPRS